MRLPIGSHHISESGYFQHVASPSRRIYAPFPSSKISDAQAKRLYACIHNVLIAK
jgi:hypothetical protein